MAGIGFRLREMATKKTFAEWLKLYTYSAVIFSGPWLVSILALAALSVFALPSMQSIDIRMFTVTIVYCYCFSLIATGLIQLVVTRYVSDQFYMRNPDAVVPTFVGSIALTVLFQTVTGSVALFFGDFDFLYKIVTLGIYVAVSVIWVEMLFLSAAKDYANIVIAFGVGYLVSFVGAQGLGAVFGLVGLSLGFLVGQVILMVLLMHRIFAEYRFGKGFDFEFLGHFRKYPTLAVSGFTYNVAIWIDKILLWYSPSGLHIHGYFYTHFPYDSAMFIAYVSIIPTLSIFLLRIETDFYLRYKNYYGTILAKAPLSQILERKREMLAVLKSAFSTVLIYQGIVTVGVFIIMPFLVGVLGIDPLYTPVFRVGVVAAFFHAGLLIVMILTLYFDFRGTAMLLSVLFLVTNATFTIVASELGPWALGFGYLTACLVSVVAGYFMFAERIRNLEYLTFMRQPIR
jgi:uncharacterized membrane protein